MTTQQQSPTWRKSSYSGNNGGQCVETAPLTDLVGIRDSKDTARGHFTVAPTSWTSFLDTLKADA